MRLNWQDPLREPSAALIPKEAMVANGTMPWGKNSTPARLHREGSTWNANSRYLQNPERLCRDHRLYII